MKGGAVGAVLKCFVPRCWTVCSLLRISGTVYLRLDQLSPACCISLKCPCVWPTWLRPFFSLLLLFYYCFLSLSVLLNSRTQMSSLFSPPPLFLSLRSLCLCSARLVYFISGVSSSVFIIPSSQFFIHVFTRSETWVHTRGHRVGVYKHVVCTYRNGSMIAGMLPSCRVCVFGWPQRNDTIVPPPWFSLLWCN